LVREGASQISNQKSVVRIEGELTGRECYSG